MEQLGDPGDQTYRQTPIWGFRVNLSSNLLGELLYSRDSVFLVPWGRVCLLGCSVGGLIRLCLVIYFADVISIVISPSMISIVFLISIFSKVKLDKFRRFASYVGLGEIGVLLFEIYILDEREVVLLFFVLSFIFFCSFFPSYVVFEDISNLFLIYIYIFRHIMV